MAGWYPHEERTGPVLTFAPRLGERLGDALIFIVLAFSFYQQSIPGENDPVPYDLMLISAMGLYFLFGLRIPRGLATPVIMWGIVLIGYSVGAMTAKYVEALRGSLQASTYLVCAFIFFASYIYEAPERRLRLLFNGYSVAAVIAAVAGIAGYFGLFPGGSFTFLGRASGTFNDPNVFGPYLIAPTLYLGHRLVTARGFRGLALVPVLIVLVLALLLSFSRGAWGSFLFSGAIFVGLTLATSRSAAQSQRLVAFSAFMGLLVVGVVAVALSTSRVDDLFQERASLVQDYDVGAEGRFDGQRRAFDMAVEHPLGIGPEQWARINRLDTHNVYLSVLVAGGFPSGLAFLAFLGMTFVRGKRAVFADGPAQPFLIVAYACVIGHMAEAIIIDVDNWRHLFLLLGMVWGGILVAEAKIPAAGRQQRGTTAFVSGFQG